MKKSREEKPTTEFPLSGKICKRKFKVKNINKKFHRVLNIAFAFGVNKKTFKCITSWCHFKTNDVDRFYSHLKEHHSEDVTIKTHSFCMICDGKIAADDYNGEFLHMIAHIEGAEQSQKLILILQAESKSDLEQNGFEDDNKKFTQKLEDKLLKELEDKSATKVANYEADSIDAELAEMFNDKKENNSKIIILGGASNDDIETVEENDIHDSAIGDDDDEPQFSVIEENLSTVPVISKSKVSDEKTKISTENFTKKLVNQTVNIPRKFRPSLSLARSLNQSPFIITGSEKKSPNKEFVKQLIRDEKLSLYHQTPQAAPAILDPIMSSPNQNDPSHSNPASTLQLTPNVKVALSGNFSKETCDINKLLTCPFHITQVTPNEPIKVLTSAEIYPWLSANHSHKMKYEICHKNMLQKNSLIALFKCMNIRCSFTTNDVELFFNHLKFHNRNQSSDKSSCLFCTYCMFKTSDEKALVHHINDVHSRDIFQCSRCFYRARDKESCYQHTLLRHKCLNTLIYKCPGPDKVDSKRDAVVMDRLKRKRQMFVAPIRCKCKFYLDRKAQAASTIIKHYCLKRYLNYFSILQTINYE